MAKKVRKIGTGYFFGYGGKFEGDETADQCICRETKKESGGVIILDPTRLERVALIRFFNGKHLDPLKNEPSFEVLCYRIFMTRSEVGTPKTTKEMADPTWFSLHYIPFGTDQMKPGDELVVRPIIAGTPVKGYLHCSEDSKEVYGASIGLCDISDLNLVA